MNVIELVLGTSKIKMVKVAAFSLINFEFVSIYRILVDKLMPILENRNVCATRATNDPTPRAMKIALRTKVCFCTNSSSATDKFFYIEMKPKNKLLEMAT